MATVQVNSWADFVQAVAVSGDTVICPEGAIWDMNEIAPEGIAGFSVNCAEIQGNGTEIKNLRVQSSITLNGGDAVQTIESLHMTNFVSESGSFFGAAGAARLGPHTEFTGCKFSGLLPQNAQYFCEVAGGYHDTRPTDFMQCSFAIEFGYNNEWYATQITRNGTIKFCRMHIQLPNGALFYPNASWSYVRIDCPAMQMLHLGSAVANVYDGDLPQLNSAIGDATTYPSVYNKDSMPQFSGAANVIGVTEAQLRDPVYLSSIGFPIGVEV